MSSLRKFPLSTASQNVVELLLNAYSAAVRRPLSEDLIVEIAHDVRLERQSYFAPVMRSWPRGLS